MTVEAGCLDLTFAGAGSFVFYRVTTTTGIFTRNDREKPGCWASSAAPGHFFKSAWLDRCVAKAFENGLVADVSDRHKAMLDYERRMTQRRHIIMNGSDEAFHRLERDYPLPPLPRGTNPVYPSVSFPASHIQ